MIIKGRRGEYRAITWADGFDPSLHDLLPLVPEAVLGRRVLIASIDSGQFKPTPDELNDGWSMQGQQAVSPLIEALSVLPAVGFDEWYVICMKVTCPVNITRRSSMDLASRPWTPVAWKPPSSGNRWRNFDRFMFWARERQPCSL
jgi:hypothetical protein